MQTLINEKTKIMEHHYGGGVLGFILSGLTVVFVTFPHKIMAFLLDGISIINPDVKQFMIDIAPFIGVATGVALLIVNIFKIFKYHKQIKQIDLDIKNKSNNTEKK